MHHVPLTFQCICRCIDERGKSVGGEEGREWRLPGFFYVGDLILCDEMEENLTATMLGGFVEMCRRCR